MQDGDPNHSPPLNSNQESEEAPQRAEEVCDTMTQLSALVSDEQLEKDSQKAAKACNTRAKLLEPVPVPVEKHAVLLQASDDNQLGFQESFPRN